jgi:site-specific DNA recombinase
MVAAIYSRKSKFTGKGESIENQVQLCKQYGENLGINEFIVYEDEGYSGGTINRPKFKEMLLDAKAKKFDTIICYRLDRISRNIADFSNLINNLQVLNIGFISIREQFDTSTPMGRAMMYIASVFAQLERETIAERVKDNMLELSKTGRWLGGQTPLGYMSESILFYDNEMKQRKMYKLSPIEDELKTVKTIYDKYLELKSLSQVYKFLLSNNVRTKQDCNWSKSTILAILTNPVYVRANESIFSFLNGLGMNTVGNPDGVHGILTYNKKKGINSYKDVEEWIAAISCHEGIINAESWLQVQNILSNNKSKAPRLGKTNTALLTGILRCSKCGSSMRVSYARAKQNSDKKLFYYTCSLKNDSGKTRCDNKNVKGDDLERMVITKLKDLSSGDGALKTELLQYISSVETENNISPFIDSIKTEISNNEHSIQNLIKQLSSNENPVVSKYIFSEIENLNTSNGKLKIKLNELNYEKNKKVDNTQEIEVILQSLGKFNELIDKVDFEHKKYLIGSIINRIYWNGETNIVDIELWGADKKK